MSPSHLPARRKSTTSRLDFCLRLNRAQAVLTRRLDAALSGLHGLSFNDFSILYHLSRAHESKLRRIDLADRVGLTASGVTRTLLPLEKLGWVSRQADPRDARVAHATLTAAGQQLLDNALVAATQVCQEATGALADAQRDQIATALATLGGVFALPATASRR